MVIFDKYIVPEAIKLFKYKPLFNYLIIVFFVSILLVVGIFSSVSFGGKQDSTETYLDFWNGIYTIYFFVSYNIFFPLCCFLVFIFQKIEHENNTIPYINLLPVDQFCLVIVRYSILMLIYLLLISAIHLSNYVILNWICDMKFDSKINQPSTSYGKNYLFFNIFELYLTQPLAHFFILYLLSFRFKSLIVSGVSVILLHVGSYIKIFSTLPFSLLYESKRIQNTLVVFQDSAIFSVADLEFIKLLSWLYLIFLIATLFVFKRKIFTYLTSNYENQI
jgi:hypothetical protein